MALFDLADVTRTIIRIIEVALVDTGHWTIPGTEPEVIADLPNRVNKEGLGLYLFHVQESGNYKNYPPPGKDEPPVALIPMGLTLFYQLCANSNEDDGTAPLQEQLMMGIAMKALHDNPEIGDTTPAGNKNRFRITLQPLSPTEAVQFWTAGESPVKLSAFYEVSVLFLEPKESKSYAGRVLSYGNYVFVKGAPQISRSENTIEFNLPSGPPARQVKISPAQAPPAPSLPGPADSTVSFIGTGFGSGDVELWLFNSRWQGPAVADKTSWKKKLVSESHLTATVRETAPLKNAPGTVNILPGIYTAQVVVIETRVLPDLSAKEFRHTSNQFPFSVTPRIDSIAPAAGTGGTIFTVTGYRFQDPEILAGEIQMYFGEKLLTFKASGPLVAEHFKISSPNTLQFMAPLSITKGPVPVRILVKGVESPPRWITAL